MSYVVLALKWRPQSFDEVAGQEAIAQTLKNAIRSGRTAHAYLFTGPRGVGKTSAARILAKAVNCEQGPTPDPCNRCDACREITTGRSLDVLEIDGASNRGIDDIRELRESVRYAPASGRAKVYIIDEVHMLTTDAFNALLKTLEEPPPHVIFVLATTEPLKVPATIVSRCQRYDFSRLRLRATLDRLQTIATAEGIAIDEDALSLIGRRAEGSMRDALTLLDQVVASGRSPLDAAGVAAALGIAGRDLYFAIGDAISDCDAGRALGLLATAYGEGQNLQEVAEELVDHLRSLLVLSLGEDLADLIDATDAERERYKAQAARGRPADLIRQLHLSMDAAARMRRSGFPRVVLEIALAEICLLPRSADLAALIRKLPQGEEGAPPAPPAGPGAPAGRRASAPDADRTAASPVTPQSQNAADEPPHASSEGEAWKAVVQRVRTQKPALGAALSGSEVVGEQGGFLTIRTAAAQGPYQRTALESSENRPVLQSAIREIYGRGLGWRVLADAGTPRESVSPAEPAAPGGGTPRGKSRSNLADIQRIAERMDGEILGPA